MPYTIGLRKKPACARKLRETARGEQTGEVGHDHPPLPFQRRDPFVEVLSTADPAVHQEDGRTFAALQVADQPAADIDVVHRPHLREHAGAGYSHPFPPDVGSYPARPCSKSLSARYPSAYSACITWWISLVPS